MARSRYNLIPAPIWPYLGPAFKGIDQDLSALESSGGGGTFPAGGDVTITQNADGTWPTITRTANVHYRWLCAYDATKWPTTANGAAAGDELVGADASVVP